MSLPCLAFYREPFRIGAAAGWRPGPLQAGRGVTRADPGRETESELRRWADEHRVLWTHLRHTRITVHVAVITRTVAAQHRYSRLFATWLNAPSAQPLTPDDRGNAGCR